MSPPLAVSMIIGISENSRIAWQTSNPSWPGSITSRSTTSYSLSFAFSIASFPSYAQSTSIPILFQTEPDALYDQFFIVNNQNSCHFLLHSNCYPVFYLLKTSILDARDLHDIFYLFKASGFFPVTDDILRL